MTSRPPLTRSLRPVAAVLAMLLVVIGAPSPVGGAPADPRIRRRDVQRQRAQKAAELNVLKASDAQVGRALDALNANLRSQAAGSADARQASTAAAEAARDARTAEARTAAELTRLRGSMRRLAVDAYVRGPSVGALAMVNAGSLSELTTRRQLLEIAVGKRTDLGDKLRATSEDLALLRGQAEEAEVRATTRRQEADSRLRQLQQAVDAKQRVADSVEARLERALAESASLATLDRQLADEIARRQAALARRIGPGGSRAIGGAVRIGAVSVTNVRGVVVNVQIAERVDGLLAAAEADGYILGGGGYRDSGDQVAVRRANCGGGDYAVYQKPASQCRPPTARPGQSMHEQGLAIDFTWQGRVINRSSPAFRWLKANAGRFGLRNLPAEPWHWSTTGN